MGAYIARDFPNVRFSGQMGTARPLAVAVAKDNTALAKALRESLDDSGRGWGAESGAQQVGRGICRS